MDIGGQVRGIGAAALVGLVLALVGAFTRWRSRDRLRGRPEVPPERVARFLTRVGILVGLVLVGLLTVSLYYGSSGYFGLRSVRSGSGLWVAAAVVWVPVLWQLVRGRLAPYPGGWSGVTSCVTFWIFPVGPVVLGLLTTPLGRLADWDRFPGKGVVPGLVLGLVYLAVPVIAFRLRNRWRADRATASPPLDVPAIAAS